MIVRDHRMHALCPYFAMFPPEFARRALRQHSDPGDLVLDPFSGRGTTLLEAVIHGRRAIATDTSPVAYCISAAKAQPTSLRRLLTRIDELEGEYHDLPSITTAGLTRFFREAFHHSTLRQIVFLRAKLKWRASTVDRFLAALVLAQLHGELDSPNFFSNQMPHTISTKPNYSVRYWRRHRLEAPAREVFGILRAKATFRLEQGAPKGDARVACADARLAYRAFRGELRMVTTVITSPPYLDVTDFDEDQWLRLWFLGGPNEPAYRLHSQDVRHRSEAPYWRFLEEAWRGIAPLMKRRSIVVCRLGARGMSAQELERRLRRSLQSAWSRVVPVGPPVRGTIKGSRATLLHAKATGLRFELDAAYMVSCRR